LPFNHYIRKENVLVFFFSLAVLAGPCLSVLFTYDLGQFPDCASYLGLADFDFDQNPVRRYRILVPFAATALKFVFGPVFVHLAPTYFKGDFSLPFSFFVANILLMSCFGVLCYRYCRAYHLPPMSALIGLLVVLTSRYTYYFASLPLIDSLFCVVVAMTLLGIRTKNTTMLICAIFLGPFARESFIFVAPVIFFYSHLKKSRLVLYFLLSGLIIFSFHFLVDYLRPPAGVAWLEADFAHLHGLKRNLHLLFSFYGLYKILVSLGFWLLLPLVTFMYLPGSRVKLRFILRPYVAAFLFLVFFQMLLSGAMERMFYLAMPVVAVICGMCADEMRVGYRGVHEKKI